MALKKSVYLNNGMELLHIQYNLLSEHLKYGTLFSGPINVLYYR